MVNVGCCLVVRGGGCLYRGGETVVGSFSWVREKWCLCVFWVAYSDNFRLWDPVL